MGQMNSRQLYYFTVIAETGSFTAAAKKLGLSQPPLSKQIMMLEEDLGVRLLNRGARKAELTEAGAYLYSRARDILSMMDTAASELQNFPSSAKGILKLGTISSSGDYLADRVLPGFCRLHPNVRFEISEGNTYELLEKLKNGIIECAVVRTPFNTEGLHCVFGTEEPLTAVGVSSWFDALPDGSIRLTDLAGNLSSIIGALTPSYPWHSRISVRCPISSAATMMHERAFSGPAPAWAWPWYRNPSAV